MDKKTLIENMARESYEKGGFNGAWLYAENGDIVVGKLRDPAELFCCRFFRTEDRTRLEPLDPKLPVMEWSNSENAEKMFWIFPVKEISIDLSDACWAGNTLSKRSTSDCQ